MNDLKIYFSSTLKEVGMV